MCHAEPRAAVCVRAEAPIRRPVCAIPVSVRRFYTPLRVAISAASNGHTDMRQLVHVSHSFVSPSLP